uniref:Ras-associating domain-containing protein n=1 Tax=Parascaris univalens TaxID=6257 RepID=A0A915CJA9_PARUN
MSCRGCLRPSRYACLIDVGLVVVLHMPLCFVYALIKLRVLPRHSFYVCWCSPFRIALMHHCLGCYRPNFTHNCIYIYMYKYIFLQQLQPFSMPLLSLALPTIAAETLISPSQTPTFKLIVAKSARKNAHIEHKEHNVFNCCCFVHAMSESTSFIVLFLKRPVILGICYRIKRVHQIAHPNRCCVLSCDIKLQL